MTNWRRACGFIVFRRRSTGPEMLLMQFARSEEWAPPEGCQERGETDMETAYRELEEETGLTKGDVTVHPTYEYTVSYPVRQGTKRSTFYLGEVSTTQEIRLSEEHGAFGWFKFYQAIRTGYHQNYKDLYAHARDFIAQNQE